ncbi:MAG: DUF1840 domain-containing protein [Tatlockia sp.]|nr:DUF1840 domain-containing protein [Tatlockia sp.]
MLVKFSCAEYENITMFGAVAKKLLTLMGHSGTVPGAIAADDIPEALSLLKKGLAKTKSSPENQQDEDEDVSVSLQHRAIPLINMLESAAKNKKSVLWE